MNLVNSTFASLVQSQKRYAGGSILQNFFGFGTAVTQTKKTITAHGSLKISGFYCGIKNISDSIALLPKQIYSRDGDRRTPLFDHPVTKLIYRLPNQCMTAFTFWKTFVTSMLVKGNGFAMINRNGAGMPVSLDLLHPEDVTVHEHDGELFYKVKGIKKLLFSDEMFHVPGFSFDGKVGISVIRYAAENMAMNLSADAFAAEAYDDRAITYGVIETDNSNLNTAGKKNIKKFFEYNLQTGDKNRVTVLEEGMKYKPISLSPAEAKFIEAKATGVGDIARWLNIPRHKLHIQGEGGYNFLVQMSLEYLQSSIQPLAEPIKQEIERKLLTQRGKEAGEYAFLNYRKLLEVDPKTRAEYYKTMYMIGAYNANKILKLEDENPRDDNGGEEYFHMANMMSESQLQKELQDES